MISAMGATHIDRDKLNKIIDGMEKQSTEIIDVAYNGAHKYMMDKFGIDISKFELIPYNNVKYIAEEKMDGYSYLCENGRFFSRNVSTAQGKEGTPIEKTDRLPHLAELMTRVSDAVGGLDVHGEIFHPGGTSDDVTSIMGCTAEEAIKRQTSGTWLHYMIYDVRSYKGMDVTAEPYWVRRLILEHVMESVIDAMDDSMFVFVPVVYVNRIRETFKVIVTHGGEGLMIKDVMKPYIPGKKPTGTWIKVKKEITIDVVIMGMNKGTGKNADLFGSLITGLYIDGELKEVANVSSGISDEIRNKIATSPDEYKGRVIEVAAMQGNNNNTSFRHPRFIRFRDDKLACQCTPEDYKTIDEV